MKNQFIFEGYPHEILLRLKAHRISQSENEGLGKSNKAVIENNLLWNKDILSVSFKGGDFNLISSIATVAQEWTKYANIKFDFGIDQNSKTFRRWVNGDSSDLRIGFEDKGYWSFVGTEALDLELCPHGSLTMNLENFNIQLPKNWKRLILHEFGHALGFHHEHQSPVTKCEFSEKFYDDMEKSGWLKDEIDLNYHQLRGGDLTYSNYDRSSIMHYFFPSEYLENGKNSPCYIESESFTLSNSDKLMAAKAYSFNEIILSSLEKLHFNLFAENNLAPEKYIPLVKDADEDVAIRVIKAIISAASNPPINPNNINPKEEKIADYIGSNHALESLYAKIELIILQSNSSAEVSNDDMADFVTFQDFIDYVIKKSK